MPYTLQMLRALIEAHPDRAERLRTHVEALELSIESQPALCLQNVRTLFEAAHATIAPYLGVTFGKRDGFPDRMQAVIAALDFSVADHPDAEKINQEIKALLDSIHAMSTALARLSNIPNMRHGGSLDWGTLQRQHARMLGGLCDSLVSFLFDAAWSHPAQTATEPVSDRYEDFAAFNAWLDDAYDIVEIAEARFVPSRILYVLDPIQYDAQRADWEAELASAASDQAAA